MSGDPLQMKLFRQASVDATRQRWLGEQYVARPPGATVALGFAVLACGLLAIALVIIEVPERLNAAGVLLPADRLLTVRAPRPGVIDQMNLQDGQRVRPGQFLLEIRDQRSRYPDNSALDQRIASLQRELALVAELSLNEQRIAEREQQDLRERTDLSRRKVSTAELELESRATLQKLAQQQAARLARLASKGSIAVQQADAQLARSAESRVAWLAATQAVLSLKSEQARLDSQLQQGLVQSQIAALHEQQALEALNRELLALEDQRSARVTAAGDGRVAGLLVREGSAVVAGQRLMTIVGAQTELRAYLYLDANDAGRITPGQPLELQLQAFPYQLYGTLGATVRSIGRVPVRAKNLELPLGVDGAVIEVQATLLPSVSAISSTLTVGTTFRAELVTHRWSLLGWLLRAGSRHS